MGGGGVSLFRKSLFGFPMLWGNTLHELGAFPVLRTDDKCTDGWVVGGWMNGVRGWLLCGVDFLGLLRL